jgi:hypothetical protein
MKVDYENLYKEWTSHDYDQENSRESMLASLFNGKDWDCADNIPQEEWLELLEIHSRQRKKLIDNILKGKHYDS